MEMPADAIVGAYVFNDPVIYCMLPCGLSTGVIYPADIIRDEPREEGGVTLCVMKVVPNIAQAERCLQLFPRGIAWFTC